MKTTSYLLGLTLAVLALPRSAEGQEDFNKYIQQAISTLEQRAERGFDGDLSAYFSQDLDYGDWAKGIIKYRPDKATRERAERARGFPEEYLKARPRTNKTMCVASVAEAIIEALNAYNRDKKSTDSQEERLKYLKKMPPRKWSRYPYQPYPKRLDIQPYLFTASWCTCTRTREIAKIKRETGKKEECEGKDLIKTASGAADALEKFGMGKVLARSRSEARDKLRPGDLVNFDRPRFDRRKRREVPAGHGVVFLGWILDKTSKKEIGFKYFAAQGATEGFGEMDAYFRNRLPVGVCPKGVQRKETNDCGVLDTNFVAGRMLHPREWGREGVLEKKMDELKAWLNESDLLCGQLDDGVDAITQDASAVVDDEFPDYPNLLIDGITESGK